MLVKRPICSVESCEVESEVRGMCAYHYAHALTPSKIRKPKKIKPIIKVVIKRIPRTSSYLYPTYSEMLQRCYNKNSKPYNGYGGRGIKVCRRWRGIKGFEHFIADMGDRPEKHTLDRIDNDGNYKPSNCRWADMITQSNNRRPRIGASGYNHVQVSSTPGRYQAAFRYAGKYIHLGQFDDPLEASIAVDKMRAKYLASHSTVL